MRQIQMKKAFHIVFICFLFSTTIRLFGQQDPKKPNLRKGAFFTIEQAQDEHARYAATFQTAQEWTNRAELIKKGILEGAEITTIRPNQPIKATIHSKKKFDGYSVENIFFESLDGIYVTGNLYRPTNFSGKIPAILAPHGHGQAPRFGEATQRRCATMARMGAVVFAYDMVGMGDMTQCDHKIELAFKLQLINSIRVADFLTQLPEIDTNRIGISGESGGGTQTFMLSAIDSRIQVSVPVVMVSGYFFGGCVCESGMPVHVRESHTTSNVEIAACFAPKPLLLISDGDDWTKFTPEFEFPYIRRVYELLGAKNAVENVHLPNEKHDYGPSKRKAAYEFLAKHLQLNLNQADESKTEVLPKEMLTVYSAEFPMPINALKGNEAIINLLNTIK